jgi:hypothetical protein
MSSDEQVRAVLFEANAKVAASSAVANLSRRSLCRIVLSFAYCFAAQPE